MNRNRSCSLSLCWAAPRRGRSWMTALCLASFLMLIAGRDVHGADHSWVGGGANNDWNTSANWSPATLPGNTEYALLGDATHLSTTAVVSEANAVCGGLSLGHVGTLYSKVEIVSGGKLTVGASGAQVGAYNGIGTIVLSGGTLEVGASISVGYASAYGAHTGIVEISSGQLTSGAQIWGQQVVGSGVQSGGTNQSSSYIMFGSTASGVGNYSLSGGKFTSGSSDLYLGGPGRGTITQSGGVASFGKAYVGDNATGSGSYTLGTGSLSCAGNLTVGNGGVGVVTQTGTGTTNAVGGSLILGSASTATGTYTHTGGLIQLGGAASRRLCIGDNGVGIFNLGGVDGTGDFLQNYIMTLVVRNTETASGTLRGWGDVKFYGGTNVMNGRVIADGYGADRTLNLSYMATVTNSIDNVSSNGWFAWNHGKLMLPALAVGNGASYWGESGNLDLVNSVKLVFSGYTSGSLSGSLLALDHGDVPSGLKSAVAVWDFSGPVFSSATLTFRYDHAMVSESHWLESGLRVYRHNGSAWSRVATEVDATAHTITTASLSALGKFAVVASPVGTMIMVQ